MTPAEYHKKRGIQPRFACDWAERAKTLRKTLETQRQLLQEVKRDYERCGELKEFRTELDDPVFNPLDYEWNQELYGDEKQEVSGAEEKQAAYGGT
ncbi:hypothetical protein BaRGS_00011952 [Batillaria attramentaria]|uniref:Uncharacterized protein n=1 Tax=Batillaria attramentaria TaxID=370345 RepID=A0ABD0LBY2_9CAEN